MAVSRFFLLSSVVSVACAALIVSGCTKINPIADDLSLVPKENIWPSVISKIDPFYIPLETPIQFHLILLTIIPHFSSMAAFHPTALEFFGRKRLSEQRRRCAPTNSAQQSVFDDHRRVTLAYAVVYSTRAADIPELYAAVGNVIRAWGLDPDRCPGGPGCDSLDTPWGLAWKISEEVISWAKRDGWNTDGSLSRKFNKIPYSDWREDKYEPKNAPWNLTFPELWQPLTEHDGHGFLFNQQHVVPHIGYAAKTVILTDAEICNRTSADPGYDLAQESRLTLARTANLDDFKKATIQAFDGKLTSLFPLYGQYFSRIGVALDSFEFLLRETMVIVALYDSLIVVWKEKVRYDKVRPPTIIHYLLGSRRVRTYAGPYQGTQFIPANEWEPYIRTMPHAEFPSGSACSCGAFARMMKLITCLDDFTDQIGGPLTLTVTKGSSKVEKNWPPKDITLKFDSWSGISEACGQSRLDGGMHFTASVPAGRTLCESVAEPVYEAFLALERGEKPGSIVKFSGGPGSGKRCPSA